MCSTQTLRIIIATSLERKKIVSTPPPTSSAKEKRTHFGIGGISVDALGTEPRLRKAKVAGRKQNRPQAPISVEPQTENI